jgi:hypothetical protein
MPRARSAVAASPVWMVMVVQAAAAPVCRSSPLPVSVILHPSVSENPAWKSVRAEPVFVNI